ncbi:RAMP3 protein, partial [Amia calva]|nr:RAMP3 protein [Amia calva]
RVYYDFSSCTEKSAQHMGCYWPNPQVESYIISIHKHFFLNCSLDRVMWLDPPDDTLTVLIFVPVCLTLAMIALVVWCSKRSDILL